MTYLPLDKKPLIQSSYVRFRELVKEVPEADRRVTIGQVAHWGGLAIVVLFFFRVIFTNNELPDFLGVVGLLGLTFGWAYKIDQIKKQKALRDEQQVIWKQMKEIGVHFANSGDRVDVYSGPISSENLVSPLSDGSYR